MRFWTALDCHPISSSNSLAVDSVACLNNTILEAIPHNDTSLIAHYDFDGVVADDRSGNANHFPTTLTYGPSAHGAKGASAYISTPVSVGLQGFAYSDPTLFLNFDVFFLSSSSELHLSIESLLSMSYFSDGTLSFEVNGSNVLSTPNIRKHEWMNMSLLFEKESIAIAINGFKRQLCNGPTCSLVLSNAEPKLVLSGHMFIDNLKISHKKNIIPRVDHKYSFGCYKCDYGSAVEACRSDHGSKLCSLKDLYSGALRSSLKSHWFSSVTDLWYSDSTESKTSAVHDAVCCK